MTNVERIKALRNCADLKGTCDICEYRSQAMCQLNMINDAAAALEADEHQIAEQQKQIAKLYMLLNNRINEISKLEAQLPKDGEWISDYDGFDYDVRCSVCGEEALIKEGGSHDHAYSHYCPNCGARMRGEHDGL